MSFLTTTCTACTADACPIHDLRLVGLHSSMQQLNNMTQLIPHSHFVAVALGIENEPHEFLGLHLVQVNLLGKTQVETEVGDVQLTACKTCGFIWTVSCYCLSGVSKCCGIKKLIPSVLLGLLIHIEPHYYSCTIHKPGASIQTVF